MKYNKEYEAARKGVLFHRHAYPLALGAQIEGRKSYDKDVVSLVRNNFNTSFAIMATKGGVYETIVKDLEFIHDFSWQSIPSLPSIKQKMLKLKVMKSLQLMRDYSLGLNK